MSIHRKRTGISLIASIIVLCMSVCMILVFLVLHSGEDRIKLHVKTVNGNDNVVYLKSNAHIVTISESSNMKLIGNQDNIFVSDYPILYQNTDDTLYIVYFVPNMQETHPADSIAVIRYIYEEEFNPQLISKYQSLGYCMFPKNV